MKIYILTIFTFFWLSSSAQFWNTTPALSTAGGSYLVAAHHVKSSIYVVDNNQIFAYSKDKGVTWTRPSTTPSSNAYVSLMGVGGRLYAVKKLNTYDFTLEYTTDDGATWITDTVGLPLNNTKTGKRSLNIRDMGNDYILAFDANTAVYKKIGDASWSNTIIDPIVNVDVINHKGTWLATGAQGLKTSANNGSTWVTLNTTGLPANFLGYKLASNKRNKLYITSGPQSGGQIIYISQDEGKTWNATNSAGLYTHFGANLGAIHAVDDYVIAAISPAIGDIKTPPPFIASTASTPDFEVGDSSGLIRGSTNTMLPFFFNVDNRLFTMFWHLYSSEPGFEGKETTSIIKINAQIAKAYPNPIADMLQIEISQPNNWKIINNIGAELLSGNALGNFELSLSSLKPGVYYLHINGQTQKLIKL
jgi:hypothetical protein